MITPFSACVTRSHQLSNIKLFLLRIIITILLELLENIFRLDEHLNVHQNTNLNNLHRKLKKA